MTIQPQRVAVTTELAGRVSASLVAEVRPQVSGIIQERLFTEGSDVKAGDVLYRIDAATYQAAGDSAKASLAKAKAALANEISPILCIGSRAQASMRAIQADPYPSHIRANTTSAAAAVPSSKPLRAIT